MTQICLARNCYGDVAGWLAGCPSHAGIVSNDNDNDNDKRLGLTAQVDQPDHKKYSTLKIKIDNKAVQKLHTS